MNSYRCAVLSIVKHAYVPRGVASHPQFELVVVADDAAQPDWVHERNQRLADEFDIPYVKDVERAVSEYNVQVAVVSSEAERHCDLSVRAAEAGLHIVQDKPMSDRLSECDRLVEAVERNGVKFVMWNRNFLPALVHARQLVEAGEIGDIRAIHCDFYFAKDCGPPVGSRGPDDPPINWLEHQIAAHVDGSDGGVGREPMGELKIEGIYPLAYIHSLTGAAVKRPIAARFYVNFRASSRRRNAVTRSLSTSAVTGAAAPSRARANTHHATTRPGDTSSRPVTRGQVARFALCLASSSLGTSTRSSRRRRTSRSCSTAASPRRSFATTTG